MENNRRPSFVGEGLVRSDKTRMMAHPLTYDDIMQRPDVKSLPQGVQESVVLEMFRNARQTRENVARIIKLQSLKDSV
jgi:hypothetical protein